MGYIIAIVVSIFYLFVGVKSSHPSVIFISCAVFAVAALLWFKNTKEEEAIRVYRKNEEIKANNKIVSDFKELDCKFFVENNKIIGFESEIDADFFRTNGQCVDIAVVTWWESYKKFYLPISVKVGDHGNEIITDHGILNVVISGILIISWNKKERLMA